MEVYVIRHTAVATGKDVCYGQSNMTLADTFLEEVEKFKKQLPTDFDAIYCSPLQRCKDLANALECKNIIYENTLMEMNFGNWENTKWNDLNQNELNNWMADFVKVKTPNGENLLELFERVKTFLDSLRKNQSSKKILVISHAGVIRCMWAYLLELPLQNIFKIPVEHNEVFVFKLKNDAFMDAIVSTK